MKWRAKRKPEFGAWRVVRRFLIFAVCCEGEWRWLEWAWIRQCYGGWREDGIVHDYENNAWHNWQWVSVESVRRDPGMLERSWKDGKNG